MGLTTPSGHHPPKGSDVRWPRHIVADPVTVVPPQSLYLPILNEKPWWRWPSHSPRFWIDVRIPCTPFSVGLDPFLGLIPGIGDRLTNLIGTIILTLTAYLHVTQIILARMSLNLLISGVVGAFPITGDLFSIWFRSHAMNAELLRRAAGQPYRETQQAKSCTSLG